MIVLELSYAMTSESSQIREIEVQIQTLKGELRKLRAANPAKLVQNSGLCDASGPIVLGDLFGHHEDLLIIHNMGEACSYCTLWADGLNGLKSRIEERCAVVIVSPDDPARQAAIKEERGWTFRMAQDPTKEFSRELGFYTDRDGWYPGVSAFHRDEDGRIFLTNYTHFGPGDDFCAIWPLFDLLAGGDKGWEPED